MLMRKPLLNAVYVAAPLDSIQKTRILNVSFNDCCREMADLLRLVNPPSVMQEDLATSGGFQRDPLAQIPMRLYVS